MPRRKPLFCCVPKCDSRESKYREDQDFHLYKFPTDKPLMRKWVAVTGRGENFIPTERSRICSKHFQSGKRSYKPTSVDFIPSIFWYNTAKVSEYCSGCRRKVCKCEKALPEPPLLDLDDVEARMLELMEEDFDDEEGEQEGQNQEGEAEGEEQYTYLIQDDSEAQATNDGTEQLEANSLLGHHFMTDGDTDVTVAIASFLQEQDFTVENEEAPVGDGRSEEVEMSLLEGSQEQEYVQPPPPEEEPVIFIRTAVDDTIERVIRWEDCTEITVRTWTKSKVEKPNIEETQPEDDNKDDGMEVDAVGGDQAQEDPETNPTQIESNKNPVNADADLTATGKNDLQPEQNSLALHTLIPDYGPDSELEREWRKRERRLIKQHKLEEKKILMQMVQSNQHKNQTIDELKVELKELKRTNKALQHTMDSIEMKMREEFEVQYKQDVKKLLDEANLNLALLQNGWAQEKKVLLEANTALAKLIKAQQVASSSGEMEAISESEPIEVEAITRIVSEPVTVPASTSSTAPAEETMIQNSNCGHPHLRIESCETSHDVLKYFTGLPSKDDFDQLYAFLEEGAKHMRYWNGKTWSASEGKLKKQKTQRIDLKNQLFLTLTRYKRGFTTKELGFFFAVDPVFISCIFITYSKLMESSLFDLFYGDYDAATEFAGLPGIVQQHYPKLWATLRIAEIRLETRPCLNINTKQGSKRTPPIFKVLFLFTPNGRIFFISPAFHGKTSDRDVILESKVFDTIPPLSEVFVDKEFDVSAECIARDLQLHVFPHEPTHSLNEDDPWEIKLMTKCKSRLEKLVGLMRYFRIFDNDLHLAGANHTPMIVRLVLLLQYYVDTRCADFTLETAT